MKRTYWRFYWPLAVGGTTVVLANQFQNGALARYPNAARELAIFAYAWGVFAFFRAALVFMPQMVNLLARSRQAQRLCLSFAVGVGVVLTAPLLWLGYTDAGGAAVGRLFDVEGRDLMDVLLYIRWLAPLVLVQSLRQYATGLLIQQGSTRIVTVWNLVHLTTTFALLFVGYRLGYPAVMTLVGAQWAAAVLHLLLTSLTVLRIYATPREREEPLAWSQALAFFWPVATTSMMFAVSRPVLYAFVSRGSDAELRVAALRVAFDFALIFHQPLNQFRNLFATFGTSDLRGIRRFQIEVVLAMTAVLVLISYTPLDRYVFSTFLGVRGDIQHFAEESLRVACWLPLVVGFRNYFHGIALAGLTTASMAAGAVIRVAAIVAAAAATSSMGTLDHRTATMILVLGFAVEATVVLTLVQKPPRATDGG